MDAKIEKFLAKKEKMEQELEKLLNGEGQKALSASFKAVFDEVPELESIIFTQYTPHWNDGEVCTFSVHDFRVTFNVPVTDEVYKGRYKTPGDHNSGVVYATETQAPGTEFEEFSYNDSKDPIAKRARKALKELMKLANDCEDVFEAAFGDGVEVTATRDGFEVEEYDHD